MPWRNMSIIDARKNFVREALCINRRLSMLDLCQNYNISTKTGYKWIERFLKDGEKGLKDLSRAPIFVSGKFTHLGKNQEIIF